MRELSVMGLSPALYRQLRASRGRLQAALSGWQLWKHGQLNLPPIETKVQPVVAPTTRPLRLPAIRDIRDLSARELLRYMNLICAETDGGTKALDWALAHYNFPPTIYHALIGEMPRLTWAAVQNCPVLDAHGKLKLPRIPKGTGIGQEFIPPTPPPRVEPPEEPEPMEEQVDEPADVQQESHAESPPSPTEELGPGNPSASSRNVMDEIVELGHDEDYIPTTEEGFVATDAVPGTREKIGVMEGRVQRGNPIHHPRDRRDYSELGPTLLASTIAPKTKKRMKRVLDRGKHTGTPQ